MELFRDLFPRAVRVAEMDPSAADPERLDPAELAQIEGTVAKRRREYAALRALAHPLLRALGAPPGPLLNGPDRAPRWPEGIVGSLSHCTGHAVAAVALRSDVVALGCDVEPCQPLPEGVAERVLSSPERALAAGQPWLGRVLFSAKEAAYKAQYLLTATLLDFDAMSIDLSPESGAFTATLNRDVAALRRGMRFPGRYARRNELIGTAVTLIRPA